MSTMTLREFIDKVEWEGGAWEALRGYGIKSNNVDDPELKRLLDIFHSLADDAENAMIAAMFYAESNVEDSEEGEDL